MDLRAENRALRAENARLRGTIVAAGFECEQEPAWADLTPAESAVMGALMLRYPRWVDAYTLEEASRTKDHVVERDVKIIQVLACKVRKKLPGSIENLHGRGYRASDAFAASAKV